MVLKKEPLSEKFRIGIEVRKLKGDKMQAVFHPPITDKEFIKKVKNMETYIKDAKLIAVTGTKEEIHDLIGIPIE